MRQNQLSTMPKRSLIMPANSATKIVSKMLKKHLPNSRMEIIRKLQSTDSIGMSRCFHLLRKFNFPMNLFFSKFYRIPGDLQLAFYCTGIQTGTADDWNKLWNRFEETNVYTETILEALGCTTDHDLITVRIMSNVNNSINNSINSI